MGLQFMIAFDDSIGNDHFVHFGLITRDEGNFSVGRALLWNT